MILTKKQNVSAIMVGTNANLSLIGSFQIIEDAITELMGLLKTDGITAKEKYKAMWVYSKTRIRFFKNIKWNNEVSIKSFISHISIAKINVDVVVKDNKEDIVLYSRTELCALDIDTQRIRKVATVGIEQSMLEDCETKDIEFAKFEMVDLPNIEKVRVKSSNIDFLHHTNNIEYIRFILDTYSVSEIERKPIKEFEIIYANQSFENDILDIRKINLNNKHLITIEKDGKVVVKSEIVFN